MEKEECDEETIVECWQGKKRPLGKRNCMAIRKAMNDEYFFPSDRSMYLVKASDKILRQCRVS